MRKVVEQFMDFLESAHLGTRGATSGWRINGFQEPDGDGIPDTCITVYYSGERPPNPKWALDFPLIQVRVRGAPGDTAGAADKTAAVRDAMLGLDSQTVDGVRWVSVTVRNSAQIGFDAKGRPLFVVNFAVIIEPATSTNRAAI